MDLILASTSPYRRTLVERLGVPFRCLAPPVDEAALKETMADASPRELAGRLAMAKALAVSRLEPDAVVIGGDQLVAFEGSILGKPGTIENAVGQLARMSGRSHELMTAIHVIHKERFHAHIDITVMTLRSLTIDQIHRYVEADRPMDCAGSYKLESRGIALFDRIESDDHSAIVGIPLMALTSILLALGFEIP